eukprot:TRINITY_DN5459_c0_g3_i2.p2 TRINITY_DN5459_c0_g3~~TRINITY_DN5459_c0_g3_i2.p2  ORF type:complete len:198 (-),score=-13.65 TRINITY_DN5459_c0_g3_i2:351-944(-)
MKKFSILLVPLPYIGFRGQAMDVHGGGPIYPPVHASMCCSFLCNQFVPVRILSLVKQKLDNFLYFLQSFANAKIYSQFQVVRLRRLICEFLTNVSQRFAKYKGFQVTISCKGISTPTDTKANYLSIKYIHQIKLGTSYRQLAIYRMEFNIRLIFKMSIEFVLILTQIKICPVKVDGVRKCDIYFQVAYIQYLNLRHN